MLNMERFKSDLEEIVNIDSGTFCIDGVRKVNDWFAKRFVDAGWQVKWFEHEYGPKSNSFLVYNKSVEELDLLVLCHTDTVFAEGEVAKRPFTVSSDGERFLGPGVADMKSGGLFALYSAEKFIKSNPNFQKLAFFFNGQHEEGGSIGTRPLMESYSKCSKVVIALEPARANGDCLRQRKGISRYTITFRGVSAHAGVNPQDGECAITEMAHWIIYLSSLNDYKNGISVNCGVVKGGTVPNAVADFAELKIDIRTLDNDDAIRLERLVFDKQNARVNEKVSVEVKGRIIRPPMRPSAITDKLCDEITKLGKEIKLSVTWGSSGGGSDASFASGMGVTALDGLGGVGGGMHTEREYLEVKGIEKRFALLGKVIDHLTK